MAGPSLIDWFKSEKRSFPWREEKTPYKVWISEIMLQQTVASVVIPYFLKFLKLFPTIEALANAEDEKLLKAWEGLGYYSRVKNLRKGAKYILETHQGLIPSDKEALLKVPGIGPYTAGAILSFAFHQRALAIDGNVTRVICRLYAINEDILKAKTKKQIEHHLLSFLPDKEPYIAMEGLIELGALVCKKAPLCSVCPLKSHCQGLKLGNPTLYPIKTKKLQITAIYRAVSLILFEEKILLRKVPEDEIMGGLHEFPYFEINEEGLKEDELIEAISEKFKVETRLLKDLPKGSHTFTRYKATLFPSLLKVTSNIIPKTPSADYFWAELKTLNTLPFSSGHKKLLNSLNGKKTKLQSS